MTSDAGNGPQKAGVTTDGRVPDVEGPSTIVSVFQRAWRGGVLPFLLFGFVVFFMSLYFSRQIDKEYIEVRKEQQQDLDTLRQDIEKLKRELERLQSSAPEGATPEKEK